MYVYTLLGAILHHSPWVYVYTLLRTLGCLYAPWGCINYTPYNGCMFTPYWVLFYTIFYIAVNTAQAVGLHPCLGSAPRCGSNPQYRGHCSTPSLLLYHASLPLEVRPFKSIYEVWEISSTLLHFRLKILHLVAIISMIVMRINWPNSVQFNRQTVFFILFQSDGNKQICAVVVFFIRTFA